MYTHYVSLGDSISIDAYPGLDQQERTGAAMPPFGLGAASLFYSNDDAVWPEFRGRDLATRFPGVSAPPEERWYWPHFTIEPGLRGASEVRRVWWDLVVR